MLQISGLNVWYGVTEIVRDVSLQVPEGACIALMGGNGTGKTTILKALSGLVAPRAGEVLFRGEPIQGSHPHDVVVKGLVQVPQGRFVWPGMSVLENLELGGVTLKDKAALRQGVADAFELFPVLAERRSRKASSLSGGEQQMLAISRALMSRPRLLTMDEPSAGLSPRIVLEMVAAIRKLRERGLTILLVEQNVGVAGALAETAYVLANGEIAFAVEGAELARNPDVIRSYLGR